MPKKRKHNSSFLTRISLRTKILFLVGIVLIFIPSVFYINETIQLMYFVPTVPEVKAVSQKIRTYSPPIAITIPAIRMNLPIEETTIQNNVWSISRIGASHLTTSANPGESGPIILYGHNTNDRFGPIRWLSPGKDILLTTKDTSKHRYTIVKTMTVNPDQMSVFFTRNQETLYLYTCDGFADLKRFIIIAEPHISPSASTSALLQ